DPSTVPRPTTEHQGRPAPGFRATAASLPAAARPGALRPASPAARPRYAGSTPRARSRRGATATRPARGSSGLASRRDLFGDATRPRAGVRPDPLRGDLPRDPLGVLAGPPDQHRRERVQEEHSDEEEPRRRGHAAAVLHRVAVVADLEGNVDPRVVGPEPGAPDDVSDVEDTPVVEHRAAALDADRAREGPLDAC